MSHAIPDFHCVDGVAAVGVAVVYIVAMSFVREPARQRFNAIFVAGAGAAYLNGGLGGCEFAFTAVATACAYRGLASYRFIAAGWLLHAGWDVVHHVYASPIVWCVPTSSAQCAVCDTVLAIWFFVGAPGVFGRTAGRRQA